MKCEYCGEPMEMISGILVCPVCDMLNKTIEEEPWIQGENDDNSEIT